MNFRDLRYKTYHRYLVEKTIQSNKHLITGAMLDIGAMRPRYNHLFNASSTPVDITPNPEFGVVFGDIQKGLAYPDNSFDSIICIEVFLYLDQYKKAIAEIYRLVKPGGYVFISTPFVYRDIGDKIRLTEAMFLQELEKFSSVKSLKIGNGFTVIWDILKRKAFQVKNKLARYFSFLLIFPVLILIKIFKLESKKDEFYSGLFFVMQK